MKAGKLFTTGRGLILSVVAGLVALPLVAAQSYQIKAMTYNINGGGGGGGLIGSDSNAAKANYMAIAQLINESGADIVAMNEVHNNWYIGSGAFEKISGHQQWIAIADNMQTLTGSYWERCYWQTMQKNWFYGTGYGNAVISRWGMTNLGSISLDVSGSDGESRVAGFVYVAAPQPFIFVCTHLSWEQNDTTHLTRASNIDAITAKVDEFLRTYPGVPVILAGDLNQNYDGNVLGKVAGTDTTPNKNALAQLRYRNWTISNDTNPSTSFYMAQIFDYISSYNNGAKLMPIEHRTISEDVSDHNPAITTYVPYPPAKIWSGGLVSSGVWGDSQQVWRESDNGVLAGDNTAWSNGAAWTSIFALPDTGLTLSVTNQISTGALTVAPGLTLSGTTTGSILATSLAITNNTSTLPITLGVPIGSSTSDAGFAAICGGQNVTLPSNTTVIFDTADNRGQIFTKAFVNASGATGTKLVKRGSGGLRLSGSPNQNTPSQIDVEAGSLSFYSSTTDGVGAWGGSTVLRVLNGGTLLLDQFDVSGYATTTAPIEVEQGGLISVTSRDTLRRGVKFTTGGTLRVAGETNGRAFDLYGCNVQVTGAGANVTFEAVGSAKIGIRNTPSFTIATNAILHAYAPLSYTTEGVGNFAINGPGRLSLDSADNVLSGDSNSLATVTVNASGVLCGVGSLSNANLVLNGTIEGGNNGSGTLTLDKLTWNTSGKLRAIVSPDGSSVGKVMVTRELSLGSNDAKSFVVDGLERLQRGNSYVLLEVKTKSWAWQLPTFVARDGWEVRRSDNDNGFTTFTLTEAWRDRWENVPLTGNAISVNFHAGQAAVTGSYGLYSVGGWNNVSGATGTNVALSNQNGNATGATLTFSAGTTYQYAVTDAALSGYLDDTDISITVNNIPYSRYAVIVYQATDTQGRAFAPPAINGTTYTWNATSNTVVVGSTAYGASRNATAIEGRNALVIIPSQITANASDFTSQTLTITGVNKSQVTNPPCGGIAAIQIVELQDKPDYWYQFDGNYTSAGKSALTISGEAPTTAFIDSPNGKALKSVAGSAHPWGAGVAYGSGAYTISTYLKSVSANNVVLFALGSNTGNPTLALASGGADVITVSRNNGNAVHTDLLTVTVPGATTQYHLYTLVGDRTNLKFYVDGVLKGTVAFTAPANGYFQWAGIYGGVSNTGYARASGVCIDDWRVYKRALTDMEVAQLSETFPILPRVSRKTIEGATTWGAATTWTPAWESATDGRAEVTVNGTSTFDFDTSIFAGKVAFLGSGALTTTNVQATDLQYVMTFDFSGMTGANTVQHGTGHSEVIAGANTILTQTGDGLLTIGAGKRASLQGITWDGTRSNSGTLAYVGDQTGITPLIGGKILIDTAMTFGSANNTFTWNTGSLTLSPNSDVTVLGRLSFPSASAGLTVNGGRLTTQQLMAYTENSNCIITLTNGAQVVSTEAFQISHYNPGNAHWVVTGAGTLFKAGGITASNMFSTGNFARLYLRDGAELSLGGAVTSGYPGATTAIYNLYCDQGTGVLSAYASWTRSSGKAFNAIVSAGSTLVMDPAQHTITFVDTISGAGELVIGRAGATGTVELSGTNTITGGITLRAGTLRLPHTAALSSGPLTLAGGTLNLGALQISNAVSVTENSKINLTLGETAANSAMINAPLALADGKTLTLDITQPSGAHLSRYTLIAGPVSGTGRVVLGSYTSISTDVPQLVTLPTGVYLIFGGTATDYTAPLKATTQTANWTAQAWTDANNSSITPDAIYWAQGTTEVQLTANVASTVTINTPVKSSVVTALGAGDLTVVTTNGNTITASAYNLGATTGRVTLDFPIASGQITAGSDTILTQGGSGTITVAEGKRMTLNAPWSGTLNNSGTLEFAHPTTSFASISSGTMIYSQGGTATTAVGMNGGAIRFEGTESFTAPSIVGNTTQTALEISAPMTFSTAMQLGKAAVTVTDGASITTPIFGLGNLANAPTTFTMTGGSILATGTDTETTNPASNNFTTFRLGHWPVAVTANLMGGSISIPNGFFFVSRDATVTVNASGTDVTAKGLRFKTHDHTAQATLNLTAGTFTLGVDGIKTTNAAVTTFTLGGGTLAASADWTGSVAATLTANTTNTFDTASHAITYSGVLSGAGMLRKIGQGTLTLSGTNTFSGGLSIEAGMVTVAANTSLGAGDVIVAPGATLAIEGEIANTIQISATALTWEGTITVGGETLNPTEWYNIGGTLTRKDATTPTLGVAYTADCAGALSGYYMITWNGGTGTGFSNQNTSWVNAADSTITLTASGTSIISFASEVMAAKFTLLPGTAVDAVVLSSGTLSVGEYDFSGYTGRAQFMIDTHEATIKAGRLTQIIASNAGSLVIADGMTGVIDTVSSSATTTWSGTVELATGGTLSLQPRTSVIEPLTISTGATLIARDTTVGALSLEAGAHLVITNGILNATSVTATGVQLDVGTVTTTPRAILVVTEGTLDLANFIVTATDVELSLSDDGKTLSAAQVVITLPTPKHWYAFNGNYANSGETALTVSGENPATAFEPSPDGQAFVSKNNSAHPWGTGVQYGSGAYTVSAAIQSVNTTNALLFALGTKDGNPGLALISAGENRIAVATHAGNVAHVKLITADVADAATQYHLYTLVCDRTNLTFYVDGESKGTVAFTVPANNNFQWAGLHGGLGNQNYARVDDVRIDDWRLYQQALTSEEVAYLAKGFPHCLRTYTKTIAGTSTWGAAETWTPAFVDSALSMVQVTATAEAVFDIDAAHTAAEFALIGSVPVTLTNENSVSVAGIQTFRFTDSTARTVLDFATGDAKVIAGVDTVLSRSGSGVLSIPTGSKATIETTWAGTIQQSGGTLVYGGTQTYTQGLTIQQNAKVEFAGDLTLGGRLGVDSGTLTISDGIVRPTEFLSNNQPGATTAVINQTGGVVDMTTHGSEPNNGSGVNTPYYNRPGNAVFGHWSGTTTYNLSGGTFNAENRYVELGFTCSSARFNQSGGTFKVKAIVGCNNQGTYNLTAGTLELEERIDLQGTGERILIGAGIVKATGAFRFVQNATLSNGATFDLSAITSPITLAGVTLPADAAVTVDLGARAVTNNEVLISWTGTQPVGTFTLTGTNATGFQAVKTDTGLVVQAALLGPTVLLRTGDTLEQAKKTAVIKAAEEKAGVTSGTIIVSKSMAEKIMLLDVTPTFTPTGVNTTTVEDVDVQFAVTEIAIDPVTGAPIISATIKDATGTNTVSTTTAAQVVTYGKATLADEWVAIGSPDTEPKSIFTTTNSTYKFFKFVVEPKSQP